MTRYLLTISGDGQQPGFILVDDDYEPKEGEAVLEERPEPGEVWDAARGSTRPPTEAEALEAAKARKIDEFARRGVADLEPLFTPGVGRDETMLLLASHVLKLCEALGAVADLRLARVVEVGEKALAKKAAVEGAQSLEELSAVEWEGE